MTTGIGTLELAVWPSYVGVCQDDPVPGQIREPITDPRYVRGQITWETQRFMGGERIVGRARVIAPKGKYTHLLYFAHPTEAKPVGSVQLPHAVELMIDGVIDVDPITNEDLDLLTPWNAK